MLLRLTSAKRREDTIIECAISKSLAYNTRYEMTSYGVKEDKRGKKQTL